MTKVTGGFYDDRLYFEVSGPQEVARILASWSVR